MKKLFINGIGMITIFILLFTACKKEKDDPKELNIITISGSTYEGINREYTPTIGFYSGTGIVEDCTKTFYQNFFEVECREGLVLQFRVFTLTDQSEIPTGTFNVTDYCKTGFKLYLIPMLGNGVKGAGISVESGTLKIDKKGAIYDVDIDAEIYTEPYGGKIKGNFFGALNNAGK